MKIKTITFHFVVNNLCKLFIYQFYYNIFIILYILYHRSTIRNNEGRLFGYFLIGLFSIRFIVEFVKESQCGIETFLPGLSTGQWLSIPFIILGFILLFNKGGSTKTIS